MEPSTEAPNSTDLRSEPNQYLEEETGVSSRVTEGGEHRPLDAGDGTARRLTDQLSQLPPSPRSANIDYLADARGTEVQQLLAGVGIVFRHQRDSGNPGEVPH
jgi:hypothetical protein